MLMIKHNSTKYQLPFHSSLYYHIKNMDQNDEEDFFLPVDMFSEESIYELINIEKYQNKQLKFETYNLLLTLSLEYLLINYNIEYNNEINNSKIKELYDILNMTDKVDKFNELLKYFNNNIDDVNLNKFSKLQIRDICGKGYTEILNWLKINTEHVFKDQIITHYDECMNGHIHVLEWFKNNYEIKYGSCMLYFAFAYGRVNIIEWIKNNYEYEFRNSNLLLSIQHACECGHVNVLDWFKNNKEYEFKYDEYGIVYASMFGHVHILEWFKNNKEYEFKYDNTGITRHGYGHIDVLEWFKNNKEYEIKYNEYTTSDACGYGRVNVLEWFKNNKEYEFKYDVNAIKNACENGHVNILEWFKNNSKEYELNYLFGEYISEVCDFVILINKNRTLSIYNGLIDNCFDINNNCFVAKNFFEAYEYLKSILIDGDVVLFENDLPDNYL